MYTDVYSIVGFLRGGCSRGGGGNWGTLRIPREDWGTLGKQLAFFTQEINAWKTIMVSEMPGMRGFEVEIRKCSKSGGQQGEEKCSSHHFSKSLERLN